jgi:PleD family two-component response regulator
VAEYAGESNSDDLVVAADGALYRAKRAGKDRVVRAIQAAF